MIPTNEQALSVAARKVRPSANDLESIAARIEGAAQCGFVLGPEFLQAVADLVRSYPVKRERGNPRRKKNVYRLARAYAYAMATDCGAEAALEHAAQSEGATTDQVRKAIAEYRKHCGELPQIGSPIEQMQARIDAEFIKMDKRHAPAPKPRGRPKKT